MEPNQFLHEALGLIAFIVPIVLIIVAIAAALPIIGVIAHVTLLAIEARNDRRLAASRAKRDMQRWARRNKDAA